MKRLAMILLLAVAIPVLGQPAEGAEVKDLISGEMFPLTMQLKDLNQDWRALRVTAQADAVQFYAATFGAGGGAYYTTGQTVTVSGETFVVGYRVATKPLNVAAMMRRQREPPAPEKLTPETSLALSLVNLRAVSSLNDIRPFSLEDELAESERLARAMREERPDASSLTNLMQLGLAVVMYSQDWDGVLPPMEDAATVQEALWPYVKSRDVFYHPETGDPYQPNASVSGKRLADFPHPKDIIIFYEVTPAADGGRCAAFLDAHGQRVERDKWHRLKRVSGIP